MKTRSSGYRFARIVAILAGAGIFVVACGILALRVEYSRPIELPQPTGPLPVGRMVLDWRDDNDVDTLAPSAGTKRELLAWIWYPATHTATATTDDYSPAELAPKQTVPTSRGLLNVWTWLTRDFSKVRGHSLKGAPFSTQQSAYPVVVFRAGASAPVLAYSTLTEDLASHGYVVVGFDAPYRTNRVVFPDGRVVVRTPANNPELAIGSADSGRMIRRLVDTWTTDVSFALDRLGQLNASDPAGTLTGHLGLTRVGAFGHSFGGATVAQFCHDDPRCTAGIDVDGAPVGRVVESSIDRPFLFLLSDHSHDVGPEADRIRAAIQSMYDRLPANGKYRVEIRGANHFTFSDDGALLKSAFVRWVLRRFGRLSIDSRRQLGATAFCVRTFFDRYLKDDASATPVCSSDAFPEIQDLK